MATEICPACDGKKELDATANMRGKEGTYHKPIKMTCPLCSGTGSATQADLMTFLQEQQDKILPKLVRRLIDAT